MTTRVAPVALPARPSGVRPMVVELVGPAGAGKSTLLQSLGELSRAAPASLSLWGLPRASLLRSSLKVLRRLAREAGGGGGLPSWDGLTQAARVDTLLDVVRSGRARGDAGVLFLDEGPVFAMAWFLVFQRESVTRGRLAGWWRHVIEGALREVDVVVCLDAPDAVLARRIRDRAKPHMVKERTEADVIAFLVAFRAAYEQVLATLAVRHGTTLLRVDTSTEPPRRVAESVWRSLAGGRT